MHDPLAAIAPSMDVKGMIIAMTGGATGLGASAVESLLRFGAAKIIVVDIREDRLDQLKLKYPGQVETVAFNLAQKDDESYDALAGKITAAAYDAQKGRAHIDVFFGNAGILNTNSQKPYDATKDFTASDIFNSFAINAAANALLFKKLKDVLEQSGGRFLFTTSPTISRTDDRKYPLYGASKTYQEVFMGCLATGNPEVPILAFDPGRLDGTGVRAEAYPDEMPGAQPGPDDIMEPLLRLMARDADVAHLRGHVIQINNSEGRDIRGRKINHRSLNEAGTEGFNVIVKMRPLTSTPGSGHVIAHYNTARSRAAIDAPGLAPYDPDGKTLGEIYGLPSQQIKLDK